MNGKLYKFHPITKENADDIDTSILNDEQKQELALMVRNGAKFYWQENEPGDDEKFSRVELQNISFVLTMTGVKIERIEHIL